MSGHRQNSFRRHCAVFNDEFGIPGVKLDQVRNAIDDRNDRTGSVFLSLDHMGWNRNSLLVIGLDGQLNSGS